MTKNVILSLVFSGIIIGLSMFAVSADKNVDNSANVAAVANFTNLEVEQFKSRGKNSLCSCTGMNCRCN